MFRHVAITRDRDGAGMDCAAHVEELRFFPIQVCDIDDSSADFGQLPRLEAVLLPGDVLCLPKRWWHHVAALDASLSVSFWYM